MVKVIKQIATAILFIICGMFIFRCCMVADKSVFDELFATESLTAAYADGEFAVQTVKVEKEIADDGYFAAYAFYFVPETGEVQVTVRWNDSVYEYTDMTEGHEYSFHLLNEATGETFPLTVLEAKKRAMSILKEEETGLDALLGGDVGDKVSDVLEDVLGSFLGAK